MIPGNQECPLFAESPSSPGQWWEFGQIVTTFYSSSRSLLCSSVLISWYQWLKTFLLILMLFFNDFLVGTLFRYFQWWWCCQWDFLSVSWTYRHSRGHKVIAKRKDKHVKGTLWGKGVGWGEHPCHSRCPSEGNFLRKKRKYLVVVLLPFWPFKHWFSLLVAPLLSSPWLFPRVLGSTRSCTPTMNGV